MGKWEDVQIREDSSGIHYLLQVKIKRNGKKVFRNRCIDRNYASLTGHNLFHSSQNREIILKAKTDG